MIGIEPEVGLADRLVDGRNVALVPDLHRDHARLGHRDGRHLVDRHSRAVDVDLHRIEQIGAGAPGAQAGKFALQRVERCAHALFDLLEVEWVAKTLFILPARDCADPH